MLRPEELRRLGWPTAPYLNSSVLLIDPAAYREQRILDRCIEVGRATPRR